MKQILLLLLIIGLMAGCATGGSQRMDAGRLSQIEPGKTTKAELLAWFGSPISQGMDTDGKMVMNWHHVRAQSYGFHTDVKSQMLSVVLSASGIVEKFSLVDDVNKPAAAAAK